MTARNKKWIAISALLIAFNIIPHNHALSQNVEHEIFIDNNEGGARRPTPPPENFLARCLANPTDRQACLSAGQGGRADGLELSDLTATTYVNCGQRGGVCKEVAVYDPDEPTTETPAAGLRSLDIKVLFDTNSAAIRGTEMAKLATLAAALRHRHAAELSFAIIGHTDARGKEDYNCRLSKDRAISVRTYLATFGVATDRLRVIAAGEYALANPKRPGAADNRQVGFAKLDASATKRDIVARLRRLCARLR